jgi:hypothetical protein
MHHPDLLDWLLALTALDLVALFLALAAFIATRETAPPGR